MPRREIDPQLPFIQLHRSSIQKCAILSGVYKLDIFGVVGRMVMFWMGLADRRIIHKATSEGSFSLTGDELRGRLSTVFGQAVELSDFEFAGFLEKSSTSDNYRVRGMSYLVDSESKRIKAKKVHLSPPRAPHDVIPGPADLRGDTSLLKKRDVGQPSLNVSTREALLSTYMSVRKEKYLFQAKDGVALSKLLALSTPETILWKWEKGLNGDGWLRVSTLAQLLQKWNDLTATGKLEKSNELKHFTDEELEHLYD